MLIDKVLVYSDKRIDASVWGFLSSHIQIHLSPSEAEGFLLARLSVHRRVEMLWADLVREKHYFLCTSSFHVHICNKLKSGGFRLVKTKSGNLNALLLLFRKHNICFFIKAYGFLIISFIFNTVFLV